MDLSAFYLHFPRFMKKSYTNQCMNISINIFSKYLSGFRKGSIQHCLLFMLEYLKMLKTKDTSQVFYLPTY